jgi:hypothetical protein
MRRPKDMTQAQTKVRATVKIDPARFLAVDLGRQFARQPLFHYFRLLRILFFFHLDNTNLRMDAA